MTTADRAPAAAGRHGGPAGGAAPPEPGATDRDAVSPERGAPDGGANLLGAVAQVITDLSTAAVTSASGLSPTAAATVSAMHQFLDRPTLDDLRRVLGLTPSGAVRLVDRLVDAGLVTRGPGADGRSRAVTLTDAGRLAAARVGAARAALLDGLLADLSAAERDTLYALLAKVMAGTVRIKDGGAWICRLCDLDACGRPAGACPAANAAAGSGRGRSALGGPGGVAGIPPK